MESVTYIVCKNRRAKPCHLPRVSQAYIEENYLVGNTQHRSSEKLTWIRPLLSRLSET